MRKYCGPPREPVWPTGHSQRPPAELLGDSLGPYHQPPEPMNGDLQTPWKLLGARFLVSCCLCSFFDCPQLRRAPLFVVFETLRIKLRIQTGRWSLKINDVIALTMFCEHHGFSYNVCSENSKASAELFWASPTSMLTPKMLPKTSLPASWELLAVPQKLKINRQGKSIVTIRFCGSFL